MSGKLSRTIFKRGKGYTLFFLVDYVSKIYKEVTENRERNYSKKAFLWDNDCIELFHALIKREWLNRFQILDFKQAYRLVFEYLEAFYNTKRIHSHCECMLPNDCEKTI
jgi:putative transposase